MHYYQKNIGDYGRDTGHLSALEHGVYNLLIDWYYLNERPITMKEAIRVSRGNPDETQVVLSEFFKETKEGWIHSYADRVIAEYHAKAERNRANGAKGGRPPKASKPIDSIGLETQVVSSGMPEETLTNNHKPITNNQEKSQKTIRAPSAHALLPDVPPELVDDFVKLRKAKRASVTQTAVDGIRREANKAGYTMEEAIRTCCERGWQGFKAEWVADNNRNNNGSNHAKPKLTPSEQTAVSIALNNGGEIPDGYENNGNVVAEVERNLRPQVDFSLRNGRERVGGSDVGEGIRWVNRSPGG